MLSRQSEGRGAPERGSASDGCGERTGLDRVVRALMDTFDISEQAQRITESALPLFRASAAIVCACTIGSSRSTTRPPRCGLSQSGSASW